MRNGRTVSVVQSDGLWRVRITWGNGSKNHIGKFATKQEAEKWIADHRLLTERTVEDRRNVRVDNRRTVRP
jgi:hypothetical protein